MAVRAKMRVTGRHEQTSAGKGDPVRQVSVTLQPVYDDGTGPNKSWSQYTPSGELRLEITNPDAYEQIKLGQAFFVDLTPTDD